ncbi:MAG: peptidoglycan-binding domain-containing protein [Acidobacteria bacterium]|nr:peptidoglycan-binding domain-containing protein [Acidobacteriota bacterium]
MESTPATPKKGGQGPEVAELHRLLTERGYPVTVDGVFGARTYQAVRAFPWQRLDRHGRGRRGGQWRGWMRVVPQLCARCIGLTRASQGPTLKDKKLS